MKKKPKEPKNQRHERRKKRIRRLVSGTPERPRVSVYRSLKAFYAQIIDDEASKTLVSLNTLNSELAEGSNKAKNNVATAKKLGQLLAQKAQTANIKKVVFDRNGYRYHGRVKAFADSLRESGLNF